MSEVITRKLPDQWTWATFGDVADLLRGVNYKKGDASKEPMSGKLPVLRANNIRRGLNFDDLVYVPVNKIKEEQFIKKGDIIISMSSGSKHLVGKAAQANDDYEGAYGAFCANLRVVADIEPKYVAYYYSSQDNLKRISASSKGSNINNLKREHILKAPIPLAPPEQQKRIVAKIEELFSHIDAGIEALKKAKQLLKQYRQSLLKAAVTGELTKEWREANKDKLEPASQLLERILKERRQKWEKQQLEQFKAKGKIPKDDKWKEKYKEPVQIENSTDLNDLPQGWVWVCLDSLIIDGPQNGLYLPKTKYGRGVPIIRIDDFQDGYVRPYEELQKVEASDSENNIYGTRAGNLVINRVNSPTHLGKCMIVKDEYAPCLFESNMMKAGVSTHIEVGYIDYFIQSKFGRSKLIKNAKWAVNQASINQQDVKNTEITLPPIEEQHVIAQLVEEKLAAMKRLMDEIDFQLIKTKKNKQSILASAFSGRLIEVRR